MVPPVATRATSPADPSMTHATKSALPAASARRASSWARTWSVWRNRPVPVCTMTSNTTMDRRLMLMTAMTGDFLFHLTTIYFFGKKK